MEEKIEKVEYWSSRWGLIFAGIAMAVGCGNIWRFPRIAAKYGGSAFIIAWIIALFVWSLPILMMEMLAGQKTRKAPIGAFGIFAGKKFTWMGAWVACVTLGITFYYSVVTGWCFKYLCLFATGGSQSTDSATQWKMFTGGYQPLALHLVAVAIGAFVIWKGVSGGIERINKIFLPALFLMLVFLMVKAVSLPGGSGGVDYLLFRFRFWDFARADLWLEAFSQSAWSTGAGWGLWLTYSNYCKKREGIAANCLIVGIGNNIASILAALIVIPTVFATIAVPATREQILAAGSQGLTFVHMVNLFNQIDGGRWMGSVFFFTLFLAALSSFIAMFEMAVRLLMDIGISRKKTVLLAGAVIGLCGAPSAMSLTVFNNQDWVWGLALLVSGLFVSSIVFIKGKELREAQVFSPLIYGWWHFCLKYCVPSLFVTIVGWWLYTATKWEKIDWWSVRGVYTPGNVLCQWLILAVVLILANGFLYKISTGNS